MIKKVPAPGLLTVGDPVLFAGCMAKHCPNPGVHDWVEAVADLDIVVSGKICSLHKEYLEGLAAKGYLVEWVTGA